MLLAGDEFARTQGGNNNAYCQDNEISWLNWNIEARGQNLIRFTQKLTALRHKYPVLRRNRFLTGDYNENLGVKDVTWINANGSEMGGEEWDDEQMHCFGMLIDGRAQVTGIKRRGQDATFLIVLNAHFDVVRFVLPTAADGGYWLREIDTNDADAENTKFEIGETYDVTARSLLLFRLEAA
jgi:glycogen operon protein